MVAAHVQEPVAEGVVVALQEGFVLSDQARGGKVALDDHGRRVVADDLRHRRVAHHLRIGAGPFRRRVHDERPELLEERPQLVPGGLLDRRPGGGEEGESVGDVRQRAALGLAEVGVVDRGEPAQQLASGAFQRPRLDAVAQHR